MDKNLNEITQDGNLQKNTHDLIKYACANGRIDDLINGALKINPRNTYLREIAQELKYKQSKPEQLKTKLDTQNNPKKDLPNRLTFSAFISLVILLMILWLGIKIPLPSKPEYPKPTPTTELPKPTLIPEPLKTTPITKPPGTQYIRLVHKFIIHAVQAFQRLFICIQST
ncbi:hypothetical protein BC008_05305 [Mastigocoleus testarum BC008]|uniref:Effector-associated domain-containing protein n=1 Tax=Mastigocoleus testarum BC008 TaxID=371196 RepID=A0A0V7ZYS0_9CYAN|nr:hypothetical protein BC008_05305 [Mastigocoleus testarum BC008]